MSNGLKKLYLPIYRYHYLER